VVLNTVVAAKNATLSAGWLAKVMRPETVILRNGIVSIVIAHKKPARLLAVNECSNSPTSVFEAGE
jgi:hypothetical protein